MPRQFFPNEAARAELLRHVDAALEHLEHSMAPPFSQGEAFQYFMAARGMLFELRWIAQHNAKVGFK